jgi:hypothetical protein
VPAGCKVGLAGRLAGGQLRPTPYWCHCAGTARAAACWPAAFMPAQHSLLEHLAPVPCRATRAAQRCWMRCWEAGPWCAWVSLSGSGKQGTGWLAGNGQARTASAGSFARFGHAISPTATRLHLTACLSSPALLPDCMPALPCSALPLQPLTTCTWRCSRQRCGTPRPARQWLHRA